MHALYFIIGGVLPYVAAIIFIVGMTHRFRVWFSMPQPTKMTLFPAPPDSPGATIVTEALLWPSLFHADGLLWLISWLFHFALGLALLGHIRVFSGLADTLLLALGKTSGGIETMSALSGSAAGILLLITAMMLFVRRIVVRRMREISGLGDYFALLLLLCVFVTGDMMRLGPSVDLFSTRLWARSLSTLSPVILEHPVFTLHLLCVELLIAYIPLSKMMHLGGIFFSHAVLRGS